MNLDTFGTIRGTASQLRDMVMEASGGYHDDLYVRVDGGNDAVHFLGQTGGQQVMSYCSYHNLKEVSGTAEAIIPTGVDKDTKGYLDYLGIAEGSGTVELRFLGEEPDDPGEVEHPWLASYWEAEGALEARVRLPSSQEDLRKVPWLLADRWTSSGSVEGADRYISRAALDTDTGEVTVDDDDLGDYVPPTLVHTKAKTVRESVIQPANFMDDVNYYPIVVRDGEFHVDLEGSQGDDRIAGQVNAETVDGPDVERHFDDGFEELFGELSGNVRLGTAPGGGDGPSPPLSVVQNDTTGRTVRHVLGPFTED